MANEEKASPDQPEAGKSKLLLFAIVGLVVVLGGGAAAFFLLKGSGAAAEASAEQANEAGDAEQAAAAAPDFFSIEPFIVNIDDGQKDRFLKLKVDLEVSSKEVSTELDQRLPQVKDIMIGLLSAQSFDDIRSPEGKDHLREELQTRLNAVVRKGTVRQVFFTEFVVQ